MDSGAVGIQTSYVLHDQSIVNINGVHARLEVVRESGSIKVIPLESRTSEGEGTATARDDVSKTNQNEETVADFAKNLSVFQDTLLYSQPQPPQHCPIQNAHEMPGTSSGELGSMAAVTDEGKLIQDQISDHKAHALFDGGSNQVPVPRLEDLQNQGDSIDPDLLEQLLSSVARDLQFINSAPNLNESSASILEPNLMLPTAKVDLGFSNANDAAEKDLPVSAESIFDENEQPLTSTLNTQSEIIFCEKDGQFESWDLTSNTNETFLPARKQILVPNTPNIEINPNPPAEVERIINSKSSFRNEPIDNSIVRKPSKKKEVPSISSKFRSIKPKPVAQNPVFFTIPVDALNVSACPPALALPNDQSLSVIDKNDTQFGRGPVEILDSKVSTDRNQGARDVSNLGPKKLNFNQVEATKVHISVSTEKGVMFDDKNGIISIVQQPTIPTQVLSTLAAFSCPVCQNSILCQSKEEFMSHLLTHPNLCILCECLFSSEVSFFSHLKRHNIELVIDEEVGAEFKCLMCEEQFLHASNVLRHMTTHVVDGFKSSNQDPRHQGDEPSNDKKNPEVKMSICHQCGKFLKAKSLTVHIKLHCPANNPDKNTSHVQCQECRSLFLNMMTYKKHLQHSCRVQNQPDSKDSLVPTVTCDQCFKPMSSSSLATHKSQYCPVANPAKQICKYCGVVLRHKHSLRNHVKWHCKKSPSATSPMKCLCNKVFRNYKAFQSHYQGHCIGREGEGNGT